VRVTVWSPECGMPTGKVGVNAPCANRNAQRCGKVVRHAVRASNAEFDVAVPNANMVESECAAWSAGEKAVQQAAEGAACPLRRRARPPVGRLSRKW